MSHIGRYPLTRPCPYNCLFGQWVATYCTALLSASTGHYATVNCKLLLLKFPCKWRYISVGTFSLLTVSHTWQFIHIFWFILWELDENLLACHVFLCVKNALLTYFLVIFLSLCCLCVFTSWFLYITPILQVSFCQNSFICVYFSFSVRLRFIGL